jgi:drug/metabolite transporter (DMT)-like permease
MWFWYAVISAVTSAISVTLNKKALKNVNASLVSWTLFAFSLPFLIYPSFKDGIPKLNGYFWLATLGSVVAFGYAKTLSLKSLKGSLMSEVVPLAFFSVLFQYVFGLVFFAEQIRPIPIFGLLLVILGGYLLKVEEAKEGFFKPFQVLVTNKNAFMYLAAMILMTVSSVMDKTAMINMEPLNQSFYLFLGNLVITILIGLYMTKKDPKWTKDLKSNFWVLFGSAFAYVIVSLAYLYGITTGGALALVSAVKKLEVFFILVFGLFLFADKPKKGVWIGSLIMLAGVFLIKLG